MTKIEEEKVTLYKKGSVVSNSNQKAADVETYIVEKLNETVIRIKSVVSHNGVAEGNTETFEVDITTDDGLFYMTQLKNELVKSEKIETLSRALKINNETAGKFSYSSTTGDVEIICQSREVADLIRNADTNYSKYKESQLDKDSKRLSKHL